MVYMWHKAEMLHKPTRILFICGYKKKCKIIINYRYYMYHYLKISLSPCIPETDKCNWSIIDPLIMLMGIDFCCLTVRISACRFLKYKTLMHLWDESLRWFRLFMLLAVKQLRKILGIQIHIYHVHQTLCLYMAVYMYMYLSFTGMCM